MGREVVHESTRASGPIVATYRFRVVRSGLQVTSVPSGRAFEVGEAGDVLTIHVHADSDSDAVAVTLADLRACRSLVEIR